MSGGGALDILLVGAIAIVLTAPLAWRFRARTFDPFEPLVLFVAAYGVMFVVRPAAMILTDARVHAGPRAVLDVSDTFTEMLLLALLGAVSFVVAYSLAMLRMPMGERSSHDRVDDRRLIAAAAGIGVVGVAGFAVVLASLDGFQTLADIFRFGRNADFNMAVETYRYAWTAFLMLIPAAVALLALGLQRRSKLLIGSFVFVSALILVRTVPLGERVALLPLFGSVFVLFYLRRGRRPSIVTLACLAALVLLVSALLSDLRGRHARGESVAESVIRATTPSRLASSILDGPDTEMAPVLAAALSVIPERLPYQYGRVVFGDLLVRPVPRPLWEGKPQPPREKVVAAIWPIEHARRSVQPEFSILLYFYWDFGVPGIIVGLAGLGFGARALYRHYLANANRLDTQLIYALAVWFVVIAVRDSPVNTVMHAAFIVGPAWLIVRFSRRRAISASHEALRTSPPPVT